MKVFQCINCTHPLFFENVYCENCGHTVGYEDSQRNMIAFANITGKQFVAGSRRYKFCKNHEHHVCNWLIEADDPAIYCSACALNRTIPNLNSITNHEKWHKLEIAKHRLIYQLQRFGLPITSKLVDPTGLCFDFLARQDNMTIMTGHSHGVITILLSEADSVLSEIMRKEMSESYRTLIGHFRHEIAHFYWDKMFLNDTDRLKEFRTLFGDERKDYDTALQEYYETGGNLQWQSDYISKYATSHPWEDWAESWAHYFHIMDVTESAYYFGLRVAPINNFAGMASRIEFDPYETNNFDVILKECIPLLFAVNGINRSMGLSDIYPFVINNPVRAKMKFIHSMLISR